MGGNKVAAETRGRRIRHASFKSRFVEARNVDVWLPDGYDYFRYERYRVLYLHDGQNLFEPAESFAGVDWGIDETLDQLMELNRIAPTIAVGIWNTPKRLLRYMPKRPYELVTDSEAAALFAELANGQSPASDRYLDFIVTELKPFIETNYRVDPSAEATTIMGASMGGLISAYAFCEYPTVFGGAGCLSTSWTIAGAPFIEYLDRHLPRPGLGKLYFDYGQEAQIEGYVDFQDDATRIAIEKGYELEKDWMVRSFPDHDHSERSWRERVSIPMRFLLQE